MNNKFRCNCPITSALDIVGDRWTLVIIKQMLIEGKKTFKDFSESEEAIATNILSSRLKMLEEFNIITKGKLPNNNKTNIYILTQKGLALTPVIVELCIWGDANMRDFQPGIIDGEHMDALKNNKEECIIKLQKKYREITD
jgi:DNA-binding HxlR family transcriptional regulator|tara:strand:+ start:1738 stop:2160 length:423 start_codon:yes stop_codon:yes gene_type:complete